MASHVPPNCLLNAAQELVTPSTGTLQTRARYLRLQQIFEAIDSDASGAISLSELRAFIDRAGFDASDDDLQQMIDDSVRPNPPRSQALAEDGEIAPASFWLLLTASASLSS